MTETAAKRESADGSATPTDVAFEGSSARWKVLVAVIVIALIVSTAIAAWIAKSRPQSKTIDSGAEGSH